MHDKIFMRRYMRTYRTYSRVSKVIALLLILLASTASAQKVSISNNLLYDATLTPNLRVGVRVAPKWSLGLTAGYHPWPTDDKATRKARHLLLSPSVRYWKDSVNVHHFFGANLIYAHYNIADIKFPFGLYKSLRDERHEGDMAAIGVFYGYSWPLGRHWNIEAMIGAAIGYAKYNRYECGHCGKKLGRESTVFGMPQAAINIVYVLPGRPAKKKPVEPLPVVVPPVVEDTVVVEPVPVVPVVIPQPKPMEVLRKANPFVHHISEYKPYDRSVALRRDKEALYVHFPLAQSALLPEFGNNSHILDRIIDVTRKMMADTTALLCKIQIVGLASIEGPIPGNEKLATNRALALQRYVQEQLQLPDSVFDTVGGGEAWADFRDQLQECAEQESGQTAKELQQALDIIDSERNLNLCEKKLRSLNGGHTWKYIKTNILSEQRNSGYIRIYYENVEVIDNKQ